VPAEPDPAVDDAARAFFKGTDLGLAVYERVRSIVERGGPVEIRVGRSQVAFRRRRGFAFLWRPGQYLDRPDAEVVLSIALPRRLQSPRWKEVVQPSPRTWMHHLEVYSVLELDGEVEGWLHEAGAAASSER
jgi:hypothetical protein